METIDYGQMEDKPQKTLIEEWYSAVLYKRIKLPEPERPDPEGGDAPDPKPHPKPNPKFR